VLNQALRSISDGAQEQKGRDVVNLVSQRCVVVGLAYRLV